VSRSPSKPILLDARILAEAVTASFRKLDPRVQLRNPVMFCVYAGSMLVTVLWIQSLWADTTERSSFILGVAAWLWFTVLFANFAEAIAEGHGKAQAASLRKSRTTVMAQRLINQESRRVEQVHAADLKIGDFVTVKAGEIIPADGEVVEGVASVDESAITGESAPVVRESGGDRSAVTGGTRVISDSLIIRVTASPGESFLDRMIAMVEGASRQNTPNEIALAILLAALSLVFLLVVTTLLPYSIFSVSESGTGRPISLTVLVALFVCLAPTTIGALLSAIGIAGMNRLSQANVIAMSGRAAEAAGDVDVLLLDKTGTITLGNRQATRFLPADGVSEQDLAESAHLASMADETAEGRSIAVLAKKRFGMRGRDLEQIRPHFVPFSARTRMSGVSVDGHEIRKGAAEAVESHVAGLGGFFPMSVRAVVQQVARSDGTPLAVCRDEKVLGVIELKDVAKGGIKDRFAELRRMGIKTVMITGDNPLTAAAIAAEAGVDDYLAEATPEAKLAPIRDYQKGGAIGGNDRRRHERRSGPRSGRRGRRHEQRHASCQRGRKHGRPRLQSDQAHRDRQHRHATVDDPRVAHDVQHRQRRRQVLCHSSRGLRFHVSLAGNSRSYASVVPHERRPLGSDLQRLDHHRTSAVGLEGSGVPARGRRPTAAEQPARLRDRGAPRTLPWNQGD
jgi:K+-transporting ATPase ATPase B chain